MSTILNLVLALVVGLVWWHRNKDALRRSGQGAEGARPCYHGVTRHDTDWRM